MVHPQIPRSRPALQLFLFGATLATTTMAGSFYAGVDPFSEAFAFVAGLPFSLTLLAILLCHEFGHYIFARRHGVPTTLPYFIPGPPFPVGTFGAFIRMYGVPRDRSALFDVGAAGPWGGMIVALPAVMVGLWLSEVEPAVPTTPGLAIELGNSILFYILTWLVLGVDAGEATITLHPVGYAGWLGLFVTFLNLLPVGQLDGGHVTYALFGQRHRLISRLFLLVIIGLGLYGWTGWFLWAVLLLFVVRLPHPDTLDADTPLDPKRRAAAWATIFLFVSTFMPVPLAVTSVEEIRDRRPPIERPRRPPAVNRELLPTALSICPGPIVPIPL